MRGIFFQHNKKNKNHKKKFHVCSSDICSLIFREKKNKNLEKKFRTSPWNMLGCLPEHAWFFIPTDLFK